MSDGKLLGGAALSMIAAALFGCGSSTSAPVTPTGSSIAGSSASGSSSATSSTSASTDGSEPGWSLVDAPLSLPDPSTPLALRDGRLLLVGNASGLGDEVRNAVFDPKTNRWSPVPLIGRWQSGNAVLFELPDGRVVAFDNGYGSSEYSVLDAAETSWVTVPLPERLGYNVVVDVADDGRIFVGDTDEEGARLRTFDPVRGTMSAPLLDDSRTRHRVPMSLGHGDFLLGGGATPDRNIGRRYFQLLTIPGRRDHDFVVYRQKEDSIRWLDVETRDFRVVPLSGHDVLLLRPVLDEKSFAVLETEVRRVDIDTGVVRRLRRASSMELPGYPSLTALSDKRLLITGTRGPWYEPWARSFDPRTEQWSLVPAPPEAPARAGILLRDGRVAFLRAPSRTQIGPAGLLIFTPSKKAD